MAREEGANAMPHVPTTSDLRAASERNADLIVIGVRRRGRSA
jgi:nucleotide-binding universal stress UspA family protein